jgi:hypothetical protein
MANPDSVSIVDADVVELSRLKLVCISGDRNLVSTVVVVSNVTDESVESL